jgi:hypothetical protein
VPRLREIPTKLGVADSVLPLPLFSITWRHLKILGFFGLWSAWVWMSLPEDAAPIGAGAIMLVALVFCPVVAGKGVDDWLWAVLRLTAVPRRTVWSRPAAPPSHLPGDGRPPSRRRLSSVQRQHIEPADVRGGLVRLVDGSRRAVCEVFAVDTSLSDDEESEEIADAFGAFLNTLRYPIQLAVRAAPFDMARYVDAQRATRPPLAPALTRLTDREDAFWLEQARVHRPTERRYFIVVPADPLPPRAGVLGVLAGIPILGAPLRRPLLERAIADQLRARCAEIERNLEPCGVTLRVMDEASLLALYHACYQEERSRLYRRALETGWPRPVLTRGRAR